MKNQRNYLLFVTLLLMMPLSEARAETTAVPNQIDDAALTFKVKTIFVNDPVLFPLGTKIEVKQGVVYLTGVVPDEKTKQLLEKMPLSVEGIKGVKSSVRVQNTFVERP